MTLFHESPTQAFDLIQQEESQLKQRDLNSFFGKDPGKNIIINKHMYYISSCTIGIKKEFFKTYASRINSKTKYSYR